MRRTTLAMIIAIAAASCSDSDSVDSVTPDGDIASPTSGAGDQDVSPEEPLRERARELFGSLPTEVQHPPSNPPSAEKTELGRLLFWDPVLSGNGDVACATCHHPDMGYAETLDLSKGVGAVGLGEQRQGGFLVKRNAPTVINTAFNGIDANGDYDPVSAPMFWDNRAESLESQSLLPIQSKEEMRGEGFAEEQILPEIVRRLSEIPDYVNRFEAVFGDPEITIERVAMAIASFERSVIADNTPFDRYLRGDNQAMTDEQKAGLEIFIEAGCADCHDGPMFSNYELHVVGVPESALSLTLPETDTGAGQFEFRTPTLRNLDVSAPYMHNGGMEDLEDVMEFYFDAVDGEDIHHQLTLSQLDDDIRDLMIDIDDDEEEEPDDDDLDDDLDDDPDAEEDDDDGVAEQRLRAIVEFLTALEDNDFDRSVPASVPSGLQPGGLID